MPLLLRRSGGSLTHPDGGADVARGLGSADFVLVGGMPGAGKSTAIEAASLDLLDVAVLDPDALRRWLAQHLPPSTPYAWYRPLCHVLHALAVLAVVIRGPGGGRLIVHDPSTRHVRLIVLSWLARRRGWNPLLVYVDVSPQDALAGQIRRGRVLAGPSFEAHVRRWRPLRQRARTGVCGGFRSVLTTREEAADTLRRVLAM